MYSLKNGDYSDNKTLCETGYIYGTLANSRCSSTSTVAKEERKKKLTCRPLFEFTCLMYLYKNVVCESVQERRFKELKKFTDERLFEHYDYFSSNQIISTSLAYIKKVVDNQA